MQRLCGRLLASGLAAGVLILAETAYAGQEPFVAFVGRDDLIDPVYLDPFKLQFTRSTGQPTNYSGESFATQRPTDQPEICDTAGSTFGGFTFSGNWNTRTSARSAGFYEWHIGLPARPLTSFHIVLKCGVLQPGSFGFLGFQAVRQCGAITGERTAPGFCGPKVVGVDRSPLVRAALPTVTAEVVPGPLNPAAGRFLLTAYRSPSDHDLTKQNPTELKNSGSLQILDGSPKTRIALTACMEQKMLVKLPVDGQYNAAGQLEYPLDEGDLIRVRMTVPSANTVDIYCHQGSASLEGIGEPPF